MSTLEHVNITVSDPQRSAQLLSKIFGWRVRWSGEAQSGGHSVHVGQPENGDSYIALYTPVRSRPNKQKKHSTIANLNHIAVTVDDLAATEQKVLAAGLQSFNHADYSPGARFYFYLPDDIEVEVVNYNGAGKQAAA